MEKLPTFDDLYSDHFSYIKFVCLKFVKDESIAEDVAQDAFVNVWRKLHTFKGQSSIKTWLHRVAINQSLMYLRRQPKIERLQLEDAVVQLLPARTSHPRQKDCAKPSYQKLGEWISNCVFATRSVRLL